MGALFDALVRLLGSVLAFFFDLLHEFMDDGVAYGLGIILLTVVISILLFPLTLKQTRATRAFTALQPEIKRIQTEYKDDPQEMQRRLMAAQREAGATPGGCLLPLLVQMPIWFALFRLLSTPLAPNYGLVDTSLGRALDNGGLTFLGMMLGVSPGGALSGEGVIGALPYLLLIVIMVATQYIQQWHATYGQTPDRSQPGAGAQQAITKIMPLFIGFISWNFPAGLVLYWTTSNVFRLGQQMLIFKIDGRPQPAQAKEPQAKNTGKSGEDAETAVRRPPPAKRRRRRRR